jgi:hypothetical protein
MREENRQTAKDQRTDMDAARSSRLTLVAGAVVVACGGLLAACSHAPTEPAPVFALPVSKIVGAPTLDGQGPAAVPAKPATPQLRYIAVPPRQKVDGMAHALVILKQAAAAPHRPNDRRKPKFAARARAVDTAAAPNIQAKASAEPPASDVPTVMFPLDEPTSTDAAQTPSKP